MGDAMLSAVSATHTPLGFIFLNENLFSKPNIVGTSNVLCIGNLNLKENKYRICFRMCPGIFHNF